MQPVNDAGDAAPWSALLEFTVTRTGDLSAALTVNYTIDGSATSGSDYTALTGSVEIPIDSATATIALDPLEDGLAEPTEDVELTITPHAAYEIGELDTATVEITDDPADTNPLVKIVASDPGAVEPDVAELNPDTATFTISRRGSTSAELTVDYTVSGTAGSFDIETLTGTVTFAIGDSSIDVPVIPRYDPTIEATETVIATITPGTEFEIEQDYDTATAWITDDELVQVDIDVDSNNDGTINAIDDAIEEQQPGAIVFYNGDDDDDNGVSDLYQNGPVSGEDDLLPANLSLVVPSGTSLDGYDLQLEAANGGEFIRLWDTADKQNEIPLGAVWTLGSGSPEAYFPSTVYVEAIAAGYLQLDLVLFDAADVEVKRDKVKKVATKVEMRYGKKDINGKKDTIKVGERLPLAIVVSPQGQKLENHLWTITPNIVADYKVVYTGTTDPTDDTKVLPTTGKVTKISKADLKRANISFVWLDAGEGIIKHAVTVNGKKLDLTSTMNVVSPATINMKFGHLPITDVSLFFTKKHGNQLGLGEATNGVLTKPGILAGYGVRPGYDPAGTFHWVNVVKDNVTWTTASGKTFTAKNTEWELDTHYPYPANKRKEFTDSPADVLKEGVVKVVNTKTEFRTVLMYKPNTAGSIWVPLWRMEWYYKGTATSANGGKTWTETANTLDSKVTTAVKDPLVFPEWGRNILATVTPVARAIKKEIDKKEP